MPIAALLLLSPQPGAPLAAPAAASIRKKKIGRRDTASGSRLDVAKTCRTAAKWAACHKAVEAAGDKRQDARSIGLNGR